MLLAGDAIAETDPRGGRIVGSTLFVMFNAAAQARDFALPPIAPAACWQVEFDTAYPVTAPAHVAGAAHYPLRGRTVAVLRRLDADQHDTAGGLP